MLPVIPLQVNDLLKKNQEFFWHHYEISLADHRLFGTFQFLTTEINKLKYTNMID